MTDKTATGGTLRDDERIMAVIEAARAVHRSFLEGASAAEIGKARVALLGSVEALDAAEKGGE